MPRKPPPSPPPLIQKAKAHLTAKETRAAEILFRQARAHAPDDWEAHFGLGRVFAMRWCGQVAYHHFDAAGKCAPERVEIWEMKAQALRHAHAPRAQKMIFLEALEKAPIPPERRQKIVDFLAVSSPSLKPSLAKEDKKMLSRASKLIEAGQGAQALKICEKLIKRAPKNGQVLTYLARAYRLEGKAQKGDATFMTALQSAPQDAHLHECYARYLRSEGRSRDALPHARQSAFLAPAPDNLRLLGQFLLQLRPDISTLAILREALALAPDDGRTHSALALAYLRLNAPKPARDHAHLAEAHLASQKGMSRFETELLSLKAQNMYESISEEKLSRLDDFVRKNPHHIEAHRTRLSGYQMVGDSTENARAAITDFASEFPDCAEPYLSYVKGKKIAKDDALLPKIKAGAEATKNTAWERAGFEFAAAKAAEDNGDFADAFSALERGANHINGLYDRGEFIPLSVEVDAVINMESAGDDGARPLETPAMPADAGASPPPHNAPIFVTGLPRSGTTLVEQIIAQHPTMVSGGELGILSRIVYGESGTTLQDMVPYHLYEPAFFQRIGATYRHFIADAFGEETRVSDKSIMTFLYLGILRRALPHAKVIVVRRDPRDNLLSIYKNLFTYGTNKYSYDLEKLAHHYLAFERVVDFWRERLGGWFYELSYEALVDDPENQARALVEFCDLEWNPHCLDFTKNKGRVKTLSAYQVRQPIYKSSVKLWQKYEKQLKPLIDILEGARN